MALKMSTTRFERDTVSGLKACWRAQQGLKHFKCLLKFISGRMISTEGVSDTTHER